MSLHFVICGSKSGWCISLGMTKNRHVRLNRASLFVLWVLKKLVKELAEDHQLYMMDKKGDFIRDAEIAEKPMFPSNWPYPYAEEKLQ